MFGNSVTDFDKFTDGTVGYTIAVDLTFLNVEIVSSLQGDANGTTEDPVTGNTALATLQSYINDFNAPDLAWNYSSDILIIFFKTVTFAYTNTTRFIFYGYRQAVPIKTLTQNIDIKDRDLPLFLRYALKEAKILQGKISDPKEDQEIIQLENIIGT